MTDKKQIGMVFSMPEDVAQKIADGEPLTDDERRLFAYQFEDQNKTPFYIDLIWWVSFDEFAEDAFPKNDEPMFLEMRDGSIRAAAYWEDKDGYWGFNGTLGSELNIKDIARVGRLPGIDKEDRQSVYRWD